MRAAHRRPTRHSILCGTVLMAAWLAMVAPPLAASSHREAPAITGSPKVDATDFYLFRSYEPGRDNFITLIVNYNPLQDPFAGPIYFPLDEDAFYDIHIINDNDEVEDLTFRFRFSNRPPRITLPVGNPGEQVPTPVPLLNIGPLTDPANANVARSYTVRLIRGDIRHPNRVDFLKNAESGGSRFGMPLDNIGEKSIPDYEAYARRFIYRVTIPGCGEGKVFVGQRKESFQADIGGLFDLLNIGDIFGSPSGRPSDTGNKNITSIALEVPKDCLVGGGSGLVSAWTSARLPRIRILKDQPTYAEPYLQQGDYVAVSRLGNPLVSEFLIGLPDKDLFNASHPRDDEAIVPYVTHPALPEVFEILLSGLGVRAPDLFPREDLIVGFMTGIPGLNVGGPQGEVMRLNSLLPPLPAAQQNPLGVVGGDLAGYPNGRRPGDDVVDNSLRVLMGSALPPAVAPSGQLPFTDGVEVNALMFDEFFPYLKPPLPGAPHTP
jgi:uncharacterized protein DUF4331